MHLNVYQKLHSNLNNYLNCFIHNIATAQLQNPQHDPDLVFVQNGASSPGGFPPGSNLPNTYW